jgi:hypothetical protein
VGASRSEPVQYVGDGKLGMGGKDGNEGVQESGAGTGDHLEFMPPEPIQGTNTKLKRPYFPPSCVIITI